MSMTFDTVKTVSNKNYSPFKFPQNYFPNPKGSNFDEIFKTFFLPLGLGKRKMD